MRTFGDNVRHAIESKRTTAVAVAEKIGVSSQRVDELASPTYDNPTLDTIFRLAKALEVSIESLCQGRDHEYDAMMARSRGPERLAEVWQLADRRDPETARQAWRLLQSLAGVRFHRDDGDPRPTASAPETSPDRTLASK